MTVDEMMDEMLRTFSSRWSIPTKEEILAEIDRLGFKIVQKDGSEPPIVTEAARVRLPSSDRET